MATRLNHQQIIALMGIEFPDFDLEFKNVHHRLSLLDGSIEYNVSYVYDLTGNITEERVTGLDGKVLRVSTFTYVGSNVKTETVKRDSKTIVRTYLYDTSDNITGVEQRVTTATP